MFQTCRRSARLPIDRWKPFSPTSRVMACRWSASTCSCSSSGCRSRPCPTMMVAGALAADGRMVGGGVFGISVARVGRRRRVVVLGRPTLRLSGAAAAVPRVAVAGHLRAADRRHLRALRILFAGRFQVRSRFLDGRAADGRRVANVVRSFLAAAIASAALWVGAAMAVGLLFAAQIEAVLAWIAPPRRACRLSRSLQRFALLRGLESRAALATCAIRRGDADRSGRARQALSHDEPPLVVDIGSRLAHAIATAHARRAADRPRRSRHRTRSRATARSCSIARARTRHRRSAPRRCCSRAATRTCAR